MHPEDCAPATCIGIRDAAGSKNTGSIFGCQRALMETVAFLSIKEMEVYTYRPPIAPATYPKPFARGRYFIGRISDGME